MKNKSTTLQRIKKIDRYIFFPNEKAKNLLNTDREALKEEIYKCKQIKKKLVHILQNFDSIKHFIKEKAIYNDPLIQIISNNQLMYVPNIRKEKHNFYIYKLEDMNIILPNYEDQSLVDDTEDIALSLILNAVYSMGNNSLAVQNVLSSKLDMLSFLERYAISYRKHSQLLIQLLFPEVLAPQIYNEKFNPPAQRSTTDTDLQNIIFKWLVIVFAILDQPKGELFMQGKRLTDATKENLMEYLEEKLSKSLNKTHINCINITDSTFNRAFSSFMKSFF
jgi:hypothetical protein